MQTKIKSPSYILFRTGCVCRVWNYELVAWKGIRYLSLEHATTRIDEGTKTARRVNTAVRGEEKSLLFIVSPDPSYE